MQIVEASHITLLAAEMKSDSRDAVGAVLDLPNSPLLSNGYVCLAQEGGLTVTIEPLRGVPPVQALIMFLKMYSGSFETASRCC